MSRLHDPVWRAFDRELVTKKRPTASQLEKRRRGLHETRLGLFVDADPSQSRK